MRDKDVCFAVFFEDAHDFAHKIFKVIDMFEDTFAVDLVGAAIRQEWQSLFEVGNYIHAGHIDFIDGDCPCFFLRPAAEVYDYGMIAF